MKEEKTASESYYKSRILTEIQDEQNKQNEQNDRDRGLLQKMFADHSVPDKFELTISGDEDSHDLPWLWGARTDIGNIPDTHMALRDRMQKKISSTLCSYGADGAELGLLMLLGWSCVRGNWTSALVYAGSTVMLDWFGQALENAIDKQLKPDLRALPDELRKSVVSSEPILKQLPKVAANARLISTESIYRTAEQVLSRAFRFGYSNFVFFRGCNEKHQQENLQKDPEKAEKIKKLGVASMTKTS